MLRRRHPRERWPHKLLFRVRSPGFHHAAFTFGYESGVHKSSISTNDVPPGALITFIQKGMQYLEIEANLDSVSPSAAEPLPRRRATPAACDPTVPLQEGTEVDGDFGLLAPRDLLTKSVDELKDLVRHRRETALEARKRSHEEATTAMEVDEGAGGGVPEFTPDQVMTLVGHKSELFNCAW